VFGNKLKAYFPIS